MYSIVNLFSLIIEANLRPHCEKDSQFLELPHLFELMALVNSTSLLKKNGFH